MFSNLFSQENQINTLPENSFAFNLGTGYSILTGNFGENYENSINFNLDIELYSKKHIFSLNNITIPTVSNSYDNIGFGEDISVFNYSELSYGYSIYESNTFQIFPFAGFNLFNSKYLDNFGMENKNIGFGFQAGMNTDINFFSDEDDTRYFLRLRLSYSNPITCRNTYINGGVINFIVGIGLKLAK